MVKAGESDGGVNLSGHERASHGVAETRVRLAAVALGGMGAGLVVAMLPVASGGAMALAVSLGVASISAYLWAGRRARTHDLKWVSSSGGWGDESQLRAMSETTSDWVLEVDERGWVLYLNPAAKDVLGDATDWAGEVQPLVLTDIADEAFCDAFASWVVSARAGAWWQDRVTLRHGEANEAYRALAIVLVRGAADARRVWLMLRSACRGVALGSGGRPKRASRARLKALGSSDEVPAGADAVVSELRKAMSHAVGALDLLFQPQVRVSDGAIVAVEGLVRWRHPTLGNLDPSYFVPLVEQGGAVKRLTDWVLERACDQIATWRTHGVRMIVTINVSGSEIQEADFAARVNAALLRHGISPGALELEIPASSIGRIGDNGMAQLVRLRSLGMRVAVDDLASVARGEAGLVVLPVDRLKISRAVTCGLAGSMPKRRTLFELTALAGRLGVPASAVGVECMGDLEVLVQSRCKYAQGRLFYPELSARDCLDVLVEAQSPALDPDTEMSDGQ